MTDELSLIKFARTQKNLAMDERDLGNWDGALQILDHVIEELTAALRDTNKSPEPNAELHEFSNSVKKQLYHLLGSKGGVYRRRAQSEEQLAGDLEKAAECYDQGLEIEREFTDSYNLVQRLVTRVMLQPRASVMDGVEVRGVALRAELRAALGTVGAQIAPTAPRARDEYGIADFMLLSILLGEADWSAQVRRFLTLAPAGSYARSVTLDVFNEIVARLSAVPDEVAPLKERLVSTISAFGGTNG